MKRFQLVDVEYGSREEMESLLIELKRDYPREGNDLVVMEIA